MNKETIKNQAEVIARVFEAQTKHKMNHSTALEILSALYGKKNYNVLSAFIKPENALKELGDDEQEHALDAKDNKYNDECVIPAINGRQIISSSYPDECDYIRITDRAGNEIAYWDSQEWADDPKVVMGAIMGALNAGEACLPQFATKKDKGLQILNQPLSEEQIKEILTNGHGKVVIPLDLEDLGDIEATNDIAESLIVGDKNIVWTQDGEEQECRVTLTDIGYTPVGALDGQVLVEVTFMLDVY